MSLASDFLQGTGFSSPHDAIKNGVKTLKEWSEYLERHRLAVQSKRDVPRGRPKILSDETVIQVWQMRQAGAKLQDIADALDTSVASVCRILSGRSYTHIKV